MKKFGMTLLVLGLIGFLTAIASGADVAGQWRAEFNSPRGDQKYQFTFQSDGEKLTGKAAVEVGNRKRHASSSRARSRATTIAPAAARRFSASRLTARE